jgi:hypothetical protein
MRLQQREVPMTAEEERQQRGPGVATAAVRRLTYPASAPTGATGTPIPAVSPYGPQANPVRPTSFGARGAQVAAALPAIAPGVSSVLSGAGNDISTQTKAGNYGAAAGQAVRGALALPVAAFDDVVARPTRAVGDALAPVAAGAGNFANTVLTGSNAPAFGVSPASAATVPGAAVGTANPTDSRLRSGTQTTPGGLPAAGAAPIDEATAPSTPGGIIVDGRDARGKANSFTDGRSPGLGARGPISAQNMAAADALAARYDGSAKAQYDQEVADAAATNAQGGFGTGGAMSPRAALTAQLAGKKLTAKGARLVADLERTDNEAARDASTAQLGARRQASADQAQAQEGVLKGGQIRLAAQLESTRNELLNAKTPEAKAAATERLRALQGKYERETPDVFTTTAIPAGIDPATGMARGAGAIVTNRATGETRIISADEAKGQAAKPAIAEGSTSTVNGKSAKYIGGKWVPQ